jgi:hypothetical protein
MLSRRTARRTKVEVTIALTVCRDCQRHDKYVAEEMMAPVFQGSTFYLVAAHRFNPPTPWFRPEFLHHHMVCSPTHYYRCKRLLVNSESVRSWPQAMAAADGGAGIGMTSVRERS